VLLNAECVKAGVQKQTHDPQVRAVKQGITVPQDYGKEFARRFHIYEGGNPFLRYENRKVKYKLRKIKYRLNI
jgi:hypothetical protein